FDTNAFDDSLTGGLTEALRALPASGPLQERAIHLAMTATAPPAGAVPLGGRAGGARGAAAPADAGAMPIAAGAANGGARPSGADADASSWTNELQARTH